MLSRRECVFALGAGAAEAAARPDLLEQWRRIAASTDGIVGASALHLGSEKLVSIKGDEMFPLASVCKVPIAMHMLALVDEGNFSLDQKIEVLPRDVWSGVSSLAPRWPTERSFALSEMIHLMVAESDNTAVETLYRVGGESPALASRFRQWNVNGIRIDRGERQCGLDRNGVEHYPPAAEWSDSLINQLIEKVPMAKRVEATRRYLSDPRDTGTPNGTVQLLARVFRGEALSKSSTDRLVASLKASATFPGRLKGMLPSGTVVAHKTGSSGSIQGFTAATNDSGVIFLPGGTELAVSVYVKASSRSDAERDRVIARIARAAYDAWA